MKSNYVSQIDTSLKDYVDYLIETESEEIATDGGNNRLVKRYFKDVYGIEVDNYLASKVHALTRIRSRILEENPLKDKRIKERGRNTPTTNIEDNDE
jgi:hypothetical protein